MKRKRMKKVIAGMVGMSLVLGLAGCASTANNSSEQEESGKPSEEVSFGEDGTEESEDQGFVADKKDDYSDVTFQITCLTGDVGWGDSTIAQMSEIIQNFEKQYPNLKIDLNIMSYDQFTVRLSIGEPCLGDVCLLSKDLVHTVIENSELFDGYGLEPLDSYIEEGRIDLSDVHGTLAAQGAVEGETYAVPIGIGGYWPGQSILLCDCYDTAVLEELNLSLDITPTWSELLEVISEVYEKTGKGVYGQYGNGEFDRHIRAIGKNMYTEDGTDFGFEPEDVADYVDHLYDLYEYIGSWEDSWIYLSVPVSHLGTIPWENCALAVPSMTDNAVCSGIYLNPSGSFWGISSVSENKELAADFINYYVNDSSVYDVFGINWGVPVSGAMREHLISSVDEKAACALEYISNLADGIAMDTPEDSARVRGVNMENVISELYYKHFEYYAGKTTFTRVSVEQLTEEAEELMERCKPELLTD